MKYKYLRQWVNEQTPAPLVADAFIRFEDQYLLMFRQQKQYLHISLANSPCFCFFSNNQKLPKQATPASETFARTLGGATLKSIEISDTDRLISFDFTKVNLYNELEHLRLQLELIPHYQNWLLLKKQGTDWLVVDTWRKVTLAQNPARQVLPGYMYEPPPGGFTPDTDPIAYPITIQGKEFTQNPAGTHQYNNMNDAFYGLYWHALLPNRLAALKKARLSVLQKQQKKLGRKLQKQQQELKSADLQETWLKLAELLKANYGNIKTGQPSITVKDFYLPEQPELEIKLNPTFHPRQNVEFYFKKYRKAKKGFKVIQQQIESTQLELEELEAELHETSKIDSYFELKEDSPTSSKGPETGKPYRHLRINDDWEILIGKNSRENDQLVTRTGKKLDWWFHCRVFTGTHVLLRNYARKPLPDNLRLLCCRLAAYYSRAKNSTNIPVDYTQLRYVRKPRGAAPGFVTYTTQKTVYVDPISIRAAAQKVNAN